jgi:radical SAM protein with 4Fe4S-binding SPASM domain
MNNYRLRELKLEINRNCPLNCIHCSSNGIHGAPEELSANIVSKLLSDFVTLGGQKLCISGGEPLCHHEIRDIIHSSIDLNLKTTIYSTGIANNKGDIVSSLTNDIIQLLVKNNIRFIVSIHGADAYTHEKITRTKGSFNATIKAISKLKSSGVLVEAHVVPMRINFSELPQIAKLLVSLGIFKISWLRFVPQGRGLTNRESLSLTPEQFLSLNLLKRNLLSLYPNLDIRTGAPFNILCPEIPAECDAGINILTIKPDGYIAPCDAFKRFRFDDPFSNILNTSLSKVWHHSYLLNTVRRIQDLSPDSSCATCSQFTQCKSGCIAQKAVAAEMLVSGKDPDCLLKRVEVKSEPLETITV